MAPIHSRGPRYSVTFSWRNHQQFWHRAFSTYFQGKYFEEKCCARCSKKKYSNVTERKTIATHRRYGTLKFLCNVRERNRYMNVTTAQQLYRKWNVTPLSRDLGIPSDALGLILRIQKSRQKLHLKYLKIGLLHVANRVLLIEWVHDWHLEGGSFRSKCCCGKSNRGILSAFGSWKIQRRQDY